MSQHMQLIELFRQNNHIVSLSQILNTTLAAEYRARITELRKKGYIIACHKGKRASENTYIMVEPEKLAA